ELRCWESDGFGDESWRELGTVHRLTIAGKSCSARHGMRESNAAFGGDVPIGRRREHGNSRAVEWPGEAAEWNGDSGVSARQHHSVRRIRWTQRAGLYICCTAADEPEHISSASRLQPHFEQQSPIVRAGQPDE